jgi:apolipoprotein N-acyltransferase
MPHPHPVPAVRRHALRLAGAAASALLLALYAQGGAATWLGGVMLLPWLLALDRERGIGGVLLTALLFGAGVVAGSFAWFAVALDAYLGIGAPLALALLAIAAPLLQPQLLLFALVRHLAGRRHGALRRGLAGAAAWVGAEWALPKLLGDTLGHGLVDATMLRQAADLAGAGGLTVMLLLVNEALAVAIQRRRGGWRALLPPLLCALVLPGLVAGYGRWRLADLHAHLAAPAPSLRIGLVQSAIIDYEALRAEHGAYAVIRHVLDTHYAMSAHAVREQGAEALLWSETVYPTTFGQPKSADGAALDAELQQFVADLGVPLLFGTYERDARGEYNAAALLDPAKGLLGRYRKTHPFPLTEHVPGWLDGAWLRRALPWAGSWLPGDGVRVLPLRSRDGRELNITPLICLDAVRPGLAIDGARLGAQALLGLSNDSWFSAAPQGARLHLAVARFRSIETRLPQLRVTPNGHSAIIDETGALVAQTAMGQQAVLVGELPLRDPAPSLLVRWGDWLGPSALGGLALLALAALWRRWARRPVPAAPGGPRPVVLLTPARRLAAGALRGLAALGLGVLALRMLLVDGLQVNSLLPLQLFAAGVLLPLLLAALLLRLGRARLALEPGLLVLEQARQRIEIPLAQLAALEAWRLPLPASGLDLRFASGRRFGHGLMVADPAALQRALAAAGANATWSSPGAARAADWAALRAVSRHRLLDHAGLKFLVFPLLAALPAFRLHQVIAYGGPFGEWLTYGPAAWFSGLAIWWGAWALGLMLLAALLRLGIESASLLALALRRDAAALAPWRRGAEAAGRALYFLGPPLWLLLRTQAG